MYHHRWLSRDLSQPVQGSLCKALLLVLSLVHFILTVLLLGIVIRLLLLELNSEIASAPSQGSKRNRDCQSLELSTQKRQS